MTTLTRIGPAAAPDICKGKAKNDIAAHASRRLTTEIEAALHSAGYPCLDGVQVSLTPGGILLRGAVPNFFMKQLAQEIALRAGPGRVVRNEIQVV